MGSVVKNARITKAQITKADHGILTVWVTLDYGGSGQGFGGYVCYNPNFPDDCTGKFLWRLMEIAGVNSFEESP